MNKGRVKYRSDNHGLTLIELIVTIGIIGIFIGVVSTFLSTTSNTYRGTSNNSKVQMETQETFDKLEDVIINANRNLAYGTSSGQIGDDINGKDGACSTVSKIFMVSSGEDSDVVNLSEEDDDMPAVNSEDTVMTATAENGSSFGSESGENVADKAVTSNSKADDETVRDYFIWDQPSGEVRYIHSEKVNGQWQNYNEDPNGDLLATGVMDFRADISKAVTDKIVRFQLRTKSGTKTIETLHSVSLRNDLGVSSQIDSPFVNPTGAPKPSVKPTDTPVPTEPPMPTGLTLNKSTVLLAAGTSLNMSNMEISGTVNYDDGTTSSAGSLIWTIDSNCTYATLNGGVIHIQDNAGTASSGTVTLTATDTEHNNVSAQMTVYIARLDFFAPANNSSYTVGQEKQLQYTYLEGGRVPSDAGTVVKIQTVSKPNQAAEYSSGGTFAQNDVGSWNVKATVNLVERIGYDIVDVHIEKTNQFSVVQSHETEGITLGKPKDSIDIVSANDDYACSPYHQYGFSISYDKSNINYIKNVNWSLGGTYTGISIDPSNNDVTTIRVSKTAKSGFVLHADYTGVTYQNEEISLHAEKEVKVANGMEIIPLNEDKQHAYIGESYLMQVQVKVYDANGVESKLRICDNVNTDLAEFSISGNLGGTAKLSSDKKNWDYYPADNLKDYGSEEIATATLQRIPDVIFSNKNNALFVETIKFTLTEPSFSSNIVSSGSDSIEIGENKELYLELKNRKNESVNKDVTWYVNDGKMNLNVYTSQCGENSKVIFSADEPGTYVIKAEYHTTKNSVKYSTKTLQVRKPDVQLSIQGMNEVSKGGTASYWLQVTIDGNVKNDIDVQWSGDWPATFNHDSSKSNNTDKVEVAFSQWAESCTIKAGINYIGENFEIEKTIKIK